MDSPKSKQKASQVSVDTRQLSPNSEKQNIMLSLKG